MHVTLHAIPSSTLRFIFEMLILFECMLGKKYWRQQRVESYFPFCIQVDAYDITYHTIIKIQVCFGNQSIKDPLYILKKTII